MQAYANGLSDPKFSTVGAWLGSTAEPSELFSVKRMRGSSWSKHAKSVWRLVRLPRVAPPLCKFLPLLFKLELKEFPDLAVSPCKCRVPPLLAIKMSKQFLEKACVGMSDPWSLICTYLWETEKSRGHIAAVLVSRKCHDFMGQGRAWIKERDSTFLYNKYSTYASIRKWIVRSEVFHCRCLARVHCRAFRTVFW